MPKDNVWLCCPECTKTITHIDVDRDGFICTLRPCDHRFLTMVWRPTVYIDESDEPVVGLMRQTP